MLMYAIVKRTDSATNVPFATVIASDFINDIFTKAQVIIQNTIILFADAIIISF